MPEPAGATALDPDEAAGLKLDSIRCRGDLDRVEQANVIEGLRWLQRQRRPDVLSEAFLRELHRQLFGQVWRWAGRFRQTEKTIGVDPVTIGPELRLLLDDCRYWLARASYRPLEMALRFHHRLVKIHLFANGNGRHARIAADALLRFECEHPPVTWIKTSDLQQASAHRERYMRALRAADGHNYAPLLELFGAK